ncbi:hypothetical protein C1863_03265 [Eggerthella lenta]|nr:hypothetical protein C1863_03265 [Eggerthella lenta]
MLATMGRLSSTRFDWKSSSPHIRQTSSAEMASFAAPPSKNSKNARSRTVSTQARRMLRRPFSISWAATRKNQANMNR